MPFCTQPSQGEHHFTLSIHTYSRWLWIWFILVLLENSIVPLILYFVLRYKTDIKLWIICTIITCVWGLLLYIEYAIRGWKLLHRWHTYRPLSRTTITGAQNRQSSDTTGHYIEIEEHVSSSNAKFGQKLFYYDASHWIFLPTLAATLAELIIATIPKNPPIRLLSMVNPTMFFAISLYLLVLDAASFFRMQAPFRISSVASGEYVRPGLYTLLEDVVSVDIGGGHTFRREFNVYWQGSDAFRGFLRKLSIFWSLPGLLVSCICTVVIFTTDTDVGFAVGWSLLYVWATLWAGITIVVVRRSLGEEKQTG